MKIYLVGGAVRDQLLNKPVTERDWVVVGATPEQMLALGYKQVGRDFPVFIHPVTGEEYALARTERSTGPGYKHFVVHASPQVTLEEDLQRRDLTINAMAMDQEGKIIDPYHGQDDLQQHLFRHVSAAFDEDPVRILRIARFAARYGSLEFKIATETMSLMKKMVKAGAVNALVPERVWQEWQRSLIESYPEVFFQVLDECGALKILYPELNYVGKIADTRWYQALRAIRLLDTSNSSVDLSNNSSMAQIKFAALLGSLENELALTSLSSRYKVPNDYQALAQLVCRYYLWYQQAKNLTPEQLLKFLMKTDALRRSTRFKQFLLTCQVINSISFAPYADNSLFLKQVQEVVSDLQADTYLSQGLQGAAIANALYQGRIACIKNFLAKII